MSGIKTMLQQESLVSSSQDTLGISEETKPNVSNFMKFLKSNAYARNKIGLEMSFPFSADDCLFENKNNFPWISRFSRLCREAVGSQSIKILENLISVYLRNVSEDVQQCYKKPKRAGKLKTKINDALKLFHMLYSDIKKPLEYTFYLDKMSDLVSMYMDMEIKASRRSKEPPKKISQRLTSSLFVFLDNSPDHILDAVLKAKLFTKRFRDICIPILIRILRDSPGRIMYETTYIRYLLTFKLWKKLVDKKETRIEINKLAVAKLIPPFDFLDKLRSGHFSGVLPFVSKSEKDKVTSVLMQASFSVKEKAEIFLKACRDPKEGMMVVHPAEDMGKSLFFGEDMKFSCESDPEVDETSKTLMNSIWSSMQDDVGPGDCYRLCSDLSLEPKKNKKGCKKFKEKLNKNIVSSCSEKMKKKKKCKEHFDFEQDEKSKLKEDDMEIRIDKLSSMLGKEDTNKMKDEKLCEELPQSTFQNKVKLESNLVSTSLIEEIKILDEKDLDSHKSSQTVKNCDKCSKEFVQSPEIKEVIDVIRKIKLDNENKDCLIDDQIKSDQKDVDLAIPTSSTQEIHSHIFLNDRSVIVDESLVKMCNLDSKVNLDANCVEVDQTVIEPDLPIKSVDSGIESFVIKTENIEPCIVIDDDDDDDDKHKSEVIDSEHRFGPAENDLNCISNEVESDSDSICVTKHIQNDRLDSLLEGDGTSYPTIPGSESLNMSKITQGDMETPFTRDMYIGDQFLQLPSFFEGNEDVVSQVLGDWPMHQGNFGLYKEHDGTYLPTVLLKNDINLGALFPEVTVENEEEEEEEEPGLNDYRAEGQYARGAKVAFGQMSRVQDNETEWDPQDQEYEESSPTGRDDSNRNSSESSPVANNSLPLLSMESEHQSFNADKPPSATTKKHKNLKQNLENQTYAINGGYDLSKFQQVSVNLKHVTYEVAEKALSKGMFNLHNKTLIQDRFNFLIQKYVQFLYLTSCKPVSMPIPIPFETSPETQEFVLRCQCRLCKSNKSALSLNYHNLVLHRQRVWASIVDLQKFQDEELLRSIEESLSDVKTNNKEEKDEITTRSDANLPLKKRKTISYSSLKHDLNNSWKFDSNTVEEDEQSNSKRAKRVNKNVERVLTKDLISEQADCEQDKYKSGLGDIPLMKVVYTSPEGNKLKVKTLAQKKDTEIEKPTDLEISESKKICDTHMKRHHKHFRPKRSKQEKQERKERRRLKKLLKH